MFEAQEMQRIADAQSSVSDKIRALDRAGMSRAEIARFLDKRYQHVRNVLEADKQRARRSDLCRNPNLSVYQERGIEQSSGGKANNSVSGVSCGPTAFFRLTVDDDGGLRLPRHILEAFGVSAGDVLTGVAGEGELVLRSVEASVSRAQELVRVFIPGDDSLAESLIADRRREVEQERLDG